MQQQLTDWLPTGLSTPNTAPVHASLNGGAVFAQRLRFMFRSELTASTTAVHYDVESTHRKALRTRTLIERESQCANALTNNKTLFSYPWDRMLRVPNDMQLRGVGSTERLILSVFPRRSVTA